MMGPKLFFLAKQFRSLMICNQRLFMRIIPKHDVYIAKTLADLLQAQVIRDSKLSLEFYLDIDRVKTLRYIQKLSKY